MPASGYAIAYTVGGVTVTKAGAFASYGFEQGDQIHVTAGTGAKLGYFPIASRTSDDVVVIGQYATDTAYDCADGTLEVIEVVTRSRLSFNGVRLETARMV